ncbi:hypothetical protein EV174_005568, partial [Coemansia sp. RSA 2320]
MDKQTATPASAYQPPKMPANSQPMYGAEQQPQVTYSQSRAEPERPQLRGGG